MQTEQKARFQCTERQSTDTGNVVPHETSPVTPSSSENAVPLQPAKRPTRQWAAWTREEEESFFSALRQVGKNFEKITCRVQSKNKDQVRHYYYRLVRRMNKLLGPGLCLDAKNSKDTNAAMLRWWSLLEKYSCKASKLHLKPRRFKIFIEALEHQLLKDRKKNVRRRLSQGENCSPSQTAISNQNKSSANDVRVVKSLEVDSHNTQKGGQGKVSSARRNLHICVSRSGNKGESSLTKLTRQRRRSGALSAATIKRWEKAAIAGVSLVADAAEHLERSAGGIEADHQGGSSVLPVQAIGCNREKVDSCPLIQVQGNLPNRSKCIAVENDVQTTLKLKLQLFPIDETTRKALEVDQHNPHLELTLGTRKKISSVLEHLDRKWGSSSAASGELMLFPYAVQRENLLRYQRWTRDSVVTAAEVYSKSGSPPVFRLRYGWILSTELKPTALDALRSADEKNGLEKHISHCLPKRNFTCDVYTAKRMENLDDQGIRNHTLPAGEWADSLTNVSIGDLLTDVSNRTETNCAETPAFGSSGCRGETSFTCDSFDAAIAAHFSCQNKTGFPGFVLHSSSIWDAEETCDAFSFQKKPIGDRLVTLAEDILQEDSVVAGIAAVEGSAGNRSADSESNVQDEAMSEDIVKEDPMANRRQSDCEEPKASTKDYNGLNDIFWPDSLGPLELDVPSCKYYGEDVILSDSLSGLNRLISSSLDAFQNCPFFGLDEKGPASAAAAAAAAEGAGNFASVSNGVQYLRV